MLHSYYRLMFTYLPLNIVLFAPLVPPAAYYRSDSRQTDPNRDGRELQVYISRCMPVLTWWWFHYTQHINTKSTFFAAQNCIDSCIIFAFNLFDSVFLCLFAESGVFIFHYFLIFLCSTLCNDFWDFCLIYVRGLVLNVFPSDIGPYG